MLSSLMMFIRYSNLIRKIFGPYLKLYYLTMSFAFCLSSSVFPTLLVPLLSKWLTLHAPCKVLLHFFHVKAVHHIVLEVRLETISKEVFCIKINCGCMYVLFIDRILSSICTHLTLQDRDSQKTEWIDRCIEELRSDTWVLPALKQIKEICSLFYEV